MLGTAATYDPTSLGGGANDAERAAAIAEAIHSTGGGGAEPVKLDTVDAKITGPSGPVQTDFNPRDGKGHFTATEYGMHEVVVTNEGEAVKGAPAFIRSMPNSKKDYDGIEPCAVGSTVEVLVSVCVQKCFIKSKIGLLF